VGSSAFRYYDLKTSPELIRTALEDFVPWSRYPAVETLYQLLERLNAPGNSLETNDCTFCAPGSSEAPELGRLQCDGRIMVLYRELGSNLSPAKWGRMENELHRRLAPLDPEFEQGMIGTTLLPVDYLALSEQGLAIRSGRSWRTCNEFLEI